MRKAGLHPTTPAQVPGLEGLRHFVQHVSDVCDVTEQHADAVEAFARLEELCMEAARAAEEYIAPHRAGCGDCVACRQVRLTSVCDGR
jgi:hypothetical protein